MPKTKTKTKPYTATLITMGKTYVAKGDTPVEAIHALKFDRPKVYGVIAMEWEFWDKETKKTIKMKREKVVSRSIMTRLFGPASTLSREIAIKQISTLFNI